jgi:hypothetical protein
MVWVAARSWTPGPTWQLSPIVIGMTSSAIRPKLMNVFRPIRRFHP